jgi:hypothetical protein
MAPRSRQPVTFATLLMTVPNLHELSRDQGIAFSTIASWQRRGRIPREWWDQILAHARKIGCVSITHETLTEADVAAAAARKLRRENRAPLTAKPASPKRHQTGRSAQRIRA